MKNMVNSQHSDRVPNLHKTLHEYLIIALWNGTFMTKQQASIITYVKCTLKTWMDVLRKRLAKVHGHKENLHAIL